MIWRIKCFFPLLPRTNVFSSYSVLYIIVHKGKPLKGVILSSSLLMMNINVTAASMNAHLPRANNACRYVSLAYVIPAWSSDCCNNSPNLIKCLMHCELSCVEALTIQMIQQDFPHCLHLPRLYGHGITATHHSAMYWDTQQTIPFLSRTKEIQIFHTFCMFHFFMPIKSSCHHSYTHSPLPKSYISKHPLPTSPWTKQIGRSSSNKTVQPVSTQVSLSFLYAYHYSRPSPPPHTSTSHKFLSTKYYKALLYSASINASFLSDKQRHLQCNFLLICGSGLLFPLAKFSFLANTHTHIFMYTLMLSPVNK